MSRVVLGEMTKWSCEAFDHELIGRLAGRHCVDGEGPYVIIEKATLNKAATCGVASVVADIEAQAESHRDFDEQCSPYDSIGWYHTHPAGSGAFFSGTDRESQRTWTHPNSIGIVLDPSSPEDGVRVFRGPESAELEPAHEAGEFFDSAMVRVIRRKRGEWQRAHTEGIVGDHARSTVTAGSNSHDLRFWKTVGFGVVISIAFTALLVSLMTHIVVLSWAEPRSTDSVPLQELSSPADTKAQRTEIQRAERTRPSEESGGHSGPKLDDPDSGGRVR